MGCKWVERAWFVAKGADRQRCRADGGGGWGWGVIAQQRWNMGGEFGTAKIEYGWRVWDSKDGIWVERLGRQRWNMGEETGTAKMEYGWRDWDGGDGIWVERLGFKEYGSRVWDTKMEYGW